MKPQKKSTVIKPLYFANWADTWGFPIAASLLPFVSKISFLTPNVISICSFILYTLGSISLFLDYPFHLLVSAMLLPIAFIGDDLDGQVARYKKLSSVFGDFLDKVLDVVKIFIITASLSYAVYLKTENILTIYLGFASGFFFMVRYYIKLETMFSLTSRDSKYLEKSSEVRKSLENDLEKLHYKLQKTFPGKLRSLWLQHRLIFAVDEGEFVFITAVFAILNRLDLALIILAISQTSIAVWRFLERSHQLRTDSNQLLLPMRK